jgi:hypothetical protein
MMERRSRVAQGATGARDADPILVAQRDERRGMVLASGMPPQQQTVQRTLEGSGDEHHDEPPGQEHRPHPRTIQADTAPVPPGDRDVGA